MRTTLRMLGAGALSLALAACGQKADDEYAAATPDVAGLTLELTGGAPEGLAPATAAVTPPVLGSDELGDARAAIKALNAEVKRILDQVAALVQAEGAPAPGEARVYGPAIRCVQQGAAGCQAEAALLLRVQHLVLDTWSWSLQARGAASTSEADWKPVMAGWMRRGAVAHRGRGRVAFDLENLAAAAPGYTGRGSLLAGFGHQGQAKALVYKLVGFTPDAATTAPVTAAFYGHRTPAGVTRVRVATFKDVVDGGNVEFPRELELARIGWVPGVGGRGHVIVSNWLDQAQPPNLHGDVPYTAVGTDHYFLGRACWGVGGALRVKEWRFCARGDGAAACLATEPIAVEPAGASWAADCTGFAAEEPAPSDVSVGAEHGTGGEPGSGGEQAPEPMTPPVDPADVVPPAGG